MIAEVVAYALELDKLKKVNRRVKPLGLERFENPAEHSWQASLLAAALAPMAGEVDMGRVVGMLLVHDVGEIDAGDVSFFSVDADQGRKAAEFAGATRVFGLLPADQAEPLIELWREFEAGLTPKARFANAVDRSMPILLNLANAGQSWRENGVTRGEVELRAGL